MKPGFPNDFAALLSFTLARPVRRPNRIAWVAAGALCLSLVAGPACASVLWEFDQVGADVVGTFSGTLDLTGATLNFTGSQSTGGSIQPYDTLIYNGLGSVFGADGTIDSYALSSGPAGFGYGTSTTPASSSTGSPFAIEGPYSVNLGFGYSSSPGEVHVPTGYDGTTTLSGMVTFDNATFSSLGVTPGDYVYSLPSDTITLRFQTTAVTPLPPTLPLLLSGLAAFGLIGWYRKRKSMTVVTTG